MSAKKGVSLERLGERIENGEYYEAHQMYRTVYARHVKQGQYDEAIAAVLHGALLLNKHKQHSSAADLGLLLVEVYNETATSVTQETKDRVIRIFSGFPPHEPTKIKFMKNAIRWSATHGEIKTGDPEFRHLFGLSYWKEKEYHQAQKEFLYGTEESPKAVAQMLFELSISEAYKSEIEYLITRAVLQYLCLGNIRDAQVVFVQYSQLWYQRDPSLKTSQTNSVPSGTTPPNVPLNTYLPSTVTVTTSTLPLFNFSQFLILTCQRNSPQLFIALKKNYSKALSKDPDFSMLLDKIGQSYFNLAPQHPQNNFMADMMKSLFGGEDMGGAGGGPGGLLGLLGNMQPPRGGGGGRRITPQQQQQPSSSSRVASNPDLD